jgi:hypothetical protein
MAQNCVVSFLTHDPLKLSSCCKNAFGRGDDSPYGQQGLPVPKGFAFAFRD